MNDGGENIERLLRAAAQAPEETAGPAPFGFETRVVALWRSGANQPNGTLVLLRRVALLSLAVLIVSTVAAIHELKRSDEVGDAVSNEFAIADSLIQSEFAR